MIQEEKKINDIFGKDNHFQVPAGYFDQLADQIMAQIPEEKAVELANPAASTAVPRRAMKVSLWKRMGMGKIAAAIAAVVLLGGGMLIGLQHQGEKEMRRWRMPVMPQETSCTITAKMPALTRWQTMP